MREIEAKFELFDIAHVGAGDWVVGDRAVTEIARLGETPGTAREFKNPGNKARMLMKTKHITFLGGAYQGPLAPIGTDQALKGARTIWENEVRLDRRKARQDMDNLSARQDWALSATTFGHSSHKT